MYQCGFLLHFGHFRVAYATLKKISIYTCEYLQSDTSNPKTFSLIRRIGGTVSVQRIIVFENSIFIGKQTLFIGFVC